MQNLNLSAKTQEYFFQPPKMLFEFILQPLGVLVRTLVTSGMVFRQIYLSYEAF